MARNITNISEINTPEKSALDKTYQQIRNFFQTIALKMISGKSPQKIDLNEDFIITRRELEVLRLLADGYPANEIADKLFISKYTVINHRKNLISKFKARNTAELIKKAIKSHWI
jgi:DNA-binding CsgD family transcriptional regulator